MSGALYFVQIDPALKDEDIPQGFRKNQDYPVFKTNIAEADDVGEPFIELVMQDSAHKLRLIHSRFVVVQPPRKFQDRRPNNIRPLERPAVT